MQFNGRWIHEFQTQRVKWQEGAYIRENRKGRTSNDNIPYLVVGDDAFAEEKGEVYGFHLGWSGNSRFGATMLNNGDKMVQFSELLFTNEILLEQYQSYVSPILYSTYSQDGLNGMSENFHTFLRESEKHCKHYFAKRPVHFNTWEAVYFDHQQDILFKLVDDAKDLGVERFILDDGWFVGRDVEQAGLGDWFVDKDKYPQGLKPLIDRVKSQGMQFGLWFEPEMVNPDSDVFRNHPEWILKLDGYQQRLGRCQYVIDLSNPQAFEYIYKCVDDILSEYYIDYMKWDLNRDFSQPANLQNKPSAHNQVNAYYKLIEKLKTKYKNVEFESCASGGARADFKALEYTNRIWTSDCNDALERQKIQRGFSYFLPPEIMGSHFGPSPAHTTSRMASVDFRMLTHIFGHLGFEQNISTLVDNEREIVREYVDFYKQNCVFLHTNKNFRLDTVSKNLFVNGVVDNIKNRALVLISQLDMPCNTLSENLKIRYLDKNKKYNVKIVFSPKTNVSHLMKKQPTWMEKEFVASGDILVNIGLPLPVIDPQSAYLIEFTAV